jgi:hypothetical protein
MASIAIPNLIDVFILLIFLNCLLFLLLCFLFPQQKQKKRETRLFPAVQGIWRNLHVPRNSQAHANCVSISTNFSNVISVENRQILEQMKFVSMLAYL